MKNDPRDDICFTHIAIPTSFYPSPPRGPTQYPLHADYLSIHHHPRNPQTDSITVKLNNCTTCTNTIIRSPCSVTIVMAPSSQSNNQKSLAKTPKQCFSQTTNCNIRAGLVITPHIQTTITASSFHTYFHIKNITCLICYMMH